ncbi:MAG: ABC transporter substrate-binding protein [Acidimicrobiia bacterium]|nr:ABC transporter substrate-binding protein [Acidimicrobiia bacterium]
MKRTALVLSFLLLLAACGSRVDTSATGPTATVSPTGNGSSGSGGGTSAPAAADGNKIGTLTNPCSAKKAEGAAPTDTPGVSATTIKIGVISDRKNDITPVPTIGVEEAAQAFVDMCNDSGGINGRKLALTKYDSGILNTDAVTKQACQAGLFALVGDGSVQDQQGVPTREACGLPEIAAYAATSERSISKNFFSPVPGTQPDKFNAGPCKFMADKFRAATKKAAMIYTDVPASKVRGQATIEACEKEGFKYVVQAGVAFGEKNFAPVVTQMKDKGAKLLEVVSVVPDTLKILQEVKRQGLDLDVVDLGQQYYDPAMAQDPNADGAYVLTNTTPFKEKDSTPALQVYDKWMKGGPETSLGVQAFSAGLLFAQAAASLGNDLTRDSLIAALKKIHEWDGGGLQLLADPGSNAHNDCYLYLQIKDKDFVRAFPKKGFSCAKDNVVTLSKKYLTS